ncbi:MAG: hypothetical protein HIU93_15930 [Acidobacteria bacterium]|nr:hypothetical protein [Acidobacteriota bacterium]MBW4045161.1 hypothetical protein [Acidobacteriota bacterium]
MKLRTGWTGLFVFPLLAFPLIANANQIHLQKDGVSLSFDTTTAAAQLTDAKTGETWALGSPVAVERGGVKTALTVDHFSRSGPDSFTFHDNAANLDLSVQIIAQPLPSVQYQVTNWPTSSPVQEIDLLQNALTLTASSGGYYAIPKSLGIMVTPSGAAPVARRYDAYHVGNGYSMAMFGAVKDGSALLVSWDTPYADILTNYSPAPAPTLEAGVALHPGAKHLWLSPLGKGGYVEIAKAYRLFAEQRGLYKTEAEKALVAAHEQQFIGAAEFRPIAFVQQHAKDGSGNVLIHTYTTFNEVAQLAEHLRNDVGIDRAMFILSGWTQAGYDNQLPTILPAAASAGGNAGLADCSKRVKAVGFLFGLHDNYQDMYHDSPDWNPYYVIKNKDGSLMKGGVWAGGQAYFICSRVSTDLIARPQNLPGVIKLFNPDVYFLDTVFASPPRICYDPAHPTTKEQDMEYRQKLCDYVRNDHMLMGTEEGNEVGVAHADYFEGMLSQKTTSHKPGAEVVIPLFPLVYADAVTLLSHGSQKLMPESSPQFLDYLLYGQTPLYFTPQHAYWGSAKQNYHPAPGTQPGQMVFAQGALADNAFDLFVKNTYNVISPLVRQIHGKQMTNHQFLTPDHSVERTQFSDGTTITVNYGSNNYVSAEMELPQYGFAVDSPGFRAMYAYRLHDLKFHQPSFLTIHSEDGKPIVQSQQVRFFRAFGDEQIGWLGKKLVVNTELLTSAH